MDHQPDYWDVPLDEELEKKLDVQLIAELNQQYAGDDQAEDLSYPQEEENGLGLTFKIAALITAICFILIFSGYYLQGDWLPTLSAFSESQELKQLPQVKEYQNAVVLIDAGESRGTGFNIHEEGLIVTNAHVVEDKKMIQIKFAGGSVYKGTIQAIFPEVDLALVKIKGKNLPMLELAKNSTMELSEEVIVIGNPLGFPFMVSQGIVAGQVLLRDWAEPVIKISGFIYKGNSGSPVINQKGQVVGIIFAVLETGETGEEQVTGLAISSDSLQKRL